LPKGFFGCFNVIEEAVMKPQPLESSGSISAVSRIFLLTLSIVGLNFGVSATQPDLPGDWLTYGNGPAHTGYFPGKLNGLPFVRRWAATMPNWNILQPVIVGNRVIVSVGWYYSPMSLRCLDATTGTNLWSCPVGSACSINPPTYDSGSVYLQTDSSIWSINATSGQTNWVTGYTAQCYKYFAPVVAQGTVFADTGYYGGLTGFNPTNGAQKFFTQIMGNGCDEWTPAYYNGKAYMWVNGYFSEHNPLSGAVNWVITNANANEFSYSMNRTIAIADGSAYFTSRTNLFRVDLAPHTNAWSFFGGFGGTPAVANGMVYALYNGAVGAFTTNGVYVRSYQNTNSDTFAGQLIVTDDALIVAGSYGTYVFKLADGTLQQYLSSFRTPCYCYYSSYISLASNTLYIASSDGTVSAYLATDLASLFQITSVVITGNDVCVTWKTGAGQTNALQAAAGDSSGGFATNNFTDIFTATSTLGTSTNYLDVGATTNWPSRYYRVRVVP
jgi:hypothetical protein